MITSKKQYQLTQTAVEKFNEALSNVPAPEALEVDPRLLKAQIDGLRAMRDDLAEEIRLYREQYAAALLLIEALVQRGFFEALAIHADILLKVAEAFSATPQDIIFESTQVYLEEQAENRSLYFLYMGELADHALRAAGRAGYPTEAYNS